MEGLWREHNTVVKIHSEFSRALKRLREREREEENKLEEDYSSTNDLNNTVSYVSLHAADLEA